MNRLVLARGLTFENLFCSFATHFRGSSVSHSLARFGFMLVAVFAPLSGRAQSTETGMIVGRVQNAVTGDFLNNAQVSVKGSNLVAFTDSSGYYRLASVPAGEVTVRVFFTGLDEKLFNVTVTPGQTTTTDVKLTSVARYGAASDTVVLNEFVVQSTRETNAQAIAVNEQRMALGQKSVVSADQFGTIPDRNPGELMKWLPGVSVEYFANNIVGVSVRGLDAANTAISFDGLPVASASTATASTPGRGRGFEMMGASSADIARVEIRKLRTPEDSANALGGSINLIRRSAFEYSKSRLTYNALFTTDAESASFSNRAGIRDTKTQGWRPNFLLSWTDPVSKTFGYAITLSHNDVLARVHWSSPSVNFGTEAQAIAAKARLAAGQPLTTASVYNPVVTQDLLHDNPKQDITDSASVKFDWRPTADLKFSYTLAASRYQERTGDELRFTWNAGAQTTTNLDAPLGTPGTNGEHATYGNLGAGAIRYDMREAWRNGTKPVITNVLESEWRHGDWTASARGTISQSKHTFKDTDDGFFQSTTFNGSGLPLTGLGTGTANPRRITVNLLDRNFKFSQNIKSYAFNTGDTALGPEVNWQDLNNMYIGGAVSRPAKTLETVGAARLWLKRDFALANPLSVRVGFDYDEIYRNVQSYDAKMWTFVGADHIASTADDSAAQIIAVNVQPEKDSYYNSPAVPRISLSRLYDLYKAHPDWFQYRDAESHRFSTVDPYEVDEKTVSVYLQFSGAFFRNRLTYIGGVRFEKTKDWGIANLDRGSAYVASITDPLLAARARYVRKGTTGHGSNSGYFPSFEANYNFTESLILRAGYSKTQAANRFERSVIPSSTFNFAPVTTGPYSGIAIGTVNRPNLLLKPWTADNYETHLEYYTAQGGVFSIGGFLKDIQNVQVQNTVLLNTPELLAQLDLEPSFLNFQATTWVNQGPGRITGAEFEMRQPLDVWLPGVLHGFQFIGSYNYNHLSKFYYLSSGTGNPGTDFQNFYETQIKGSLGYHRGKLGITAGVIRNGRVFRQKEGIVRTDGTVAINGDRFYPAYTTVDFSIEYAVTRWAKLFVSGRNITNAQKIRYRVVDGAPAWSNFQIANNLGVTYTAGITGSF